MVAQHWHTLLQNEANVIVFDGHRVLVGQLSGDEWRLSKAQWAQSGGFEIVWMRVDKVKLKFKAVISHHGFLSDYHDKKCFISSSWVYSISKNCKSDKKKEKNKRSK